MSASGRHSARVRSWLSIVRHSSPSIHSTILCGSRSSQRRAPEKPLRVPVTSGVSPVRSRPTPRTPPCAGPPRAPLVAFDLLVYCALLLAILSPLAAYRAPAESCFRRTPFNGGYLCNAAEVLAAELRLWPTRGMFPQPIAAQADWDLLGGRRLPGNPRLRVWTMGGI